jgi:acetyl-CoA acetyltransferase
MRDVAVLGVGMHPFGKFPEKSVTELCRSAILAALSDAGVEWRDIEAVAAASSRFSGGKGWGLNGNDVVEDMGSTGIPVYNMSAGCAAGGNAFNVGYALVAGGVYDMVLVVGGEKMPKGFIQTSGVEEETDPEFLRQRASAASACRAPPSGRCCAGSAWRSSEPRRSSSPRWRSRPTRSPSTTSTRASARSSHWRRCWAPTW